MAEMDLDDCLILLAIASNCDRTGRKMAEIALDQMLSIKPADADRIAALLSLERDLPTITLCGPERDELLLIIGRRRRAIEVPRKPRPSRRAHGGSRGRAASVAAAAKPQSRRTLDLGR